jgi:hypothetical protein
MKTLIHFIFFIFFFNNVSFSNEKVVVFQFTQDELSKLKSHSFKKKTDYSILIDQNGTCTASENSDLFKLKSKDSKDFNLSIETNGCLKAEAEGQASGLGKEIKVNLDKTPYLNITWKIEQGLAGIKEDSKSGHDFAARVSVIKELGSLPWQKNVMNYVFSSNKKTDSHWTGPYRKQITDYVASSLVDSKVNTWVTVKLNVREHFKKFFNLDLGEIDGVAIMTDTDNTKRKAVSYYKNIYFSN